jgi:hypothetical protein
MASVKNCVVLLKGIWSVRRNETDNGIFITQRDAIRAAVDCAFKAGRQGHDSQVQVQDENGQPINEWNYGHDPYPLRGGDLISSRRPWLASAPAAVPLQPIANLMPRASVPLSAVISHSGSDSNAQRRNQRIEHADDSECERSSNTGWQGRAGSGSERSNHRT